MPTDKSVKVVALPLHIPRKSSQFWFETLHAEELVKEVVAGYWFLYFGESDHVVLKMGGNEGHMKEIA